MSSSLKQKIHEILNKKFEKRIHSGYDPEDVDLFFDGVINYLNDVNTVVNDLDKTNKEFQEQVKKLNEQLEQKNQQIQLISEENRVLKAEGYGNQKQAADLRSLREQIQELQSKQNKK
jgi:DivIVA domain-containing protein